MEGKRKPSRAAVLLVRDLVAELNRCGKPVESDDWVHKGIALSHQLTGAMRYAMRCDPARAADVVAVHRWHDALLHLVTTDPDGRMIELNRLLTRAHAFRTPLEINS